MRELAIKTEAGTGEEGSGSMQVVDVGAGLGGLVCARELLRSGFDVQVFEVSDGVGGRVRTDRVRGFTLNRGFQVTFTAYPALRRQLDLKRLRLRRLDPGAIIARGGRRYVLSDPLRDPLRMLESGLSPIVSPRDKLLTAMLALQMRAQSIEQVLSGHDMTTLAYLKKRGFSRAYIDNFARPFFGGVFLDRSLGTSAKCFKFDFKMLTGGFAAIPAGGMSAIPEQIADELVRPGVIRLNARVASLGRDESGLIVGVRLEDGTSISAGAVVLAVPAPEAARLSGLPLPEARNGEVNLYWEGDRPVYEGRKIVLNANSRYFVNDALQVTNLLPEHAPRGRFLLSATVVGEPPEDDATLLELGMDDLRRMFRTDPKALAALATYRPLRVYRIPYGQFAQPPGIHPHLPDVVSGIPGLFFAAEFTEASSQNAAMISGENAAAAVMRELRTRMQHMA